MRDADDAQDVRLEDEPCVLAGEIGGPGAAAGDARVVDEPVDTALVRFDVGGGACDGRIVRYVYWYETHPEPAGGGLAALLVTRRENDGKRVPPSPPGRDG